MKKSVNHWATAYLAGILAPGPEGKPAASAPVEDKAAAFIKAQKYFAKDAPKSPMAYFTAESTDQVLLNDGKYLTLQIEGYTYMGGPHGSPTAAVATFDVLTGKQLTLNDLVTDQKALQKVAEQAFRTERADVFQLKMVLNLSYSMIFSNLRCRKTMDWSKTAFSFITCLMKLALMPWAAPNL